MTFVSRGDAEGVSPGVRQSCERGNPNADRADWVPAFAGMTKRETGMMSKERSQRVYPLCASAPLRAISLGIRA